MGIEHKELMKKHCWWYYPHWAKPIKIIINLQKLPSLLAFYFLRCLKMNVWHSGSGLYDFVMSCESMQTGHTTMTTLFIFHTWRWNAWIQDVTNSKRKSIETVVGAKSGPWHTVMDFWWFFCVKLWGLKDDLNLFVPSADMPQIYLHVWPTVSIHRQTSCSYQLWPYCNRIAFFLLNINGELHHFKVSYQPLRIGAEDMRRPWRTAGFQRETLAVWKHCHSAPVGLARHLELNHWLCSCSHRPRSPLYTHH